MSDYKADFSARLQYYLCINGMTQLELSKRLGVGTTAVSNWCRGLKSPRMDKVDAMCKIFNCSRSDLMEATPPCSTQKMLLLIEKLDESEKERVIAYMQALLDAQNVDRKDSK